jgi:hypothetical protein
LLFLFKWLWVVVVVIAVSIRILILAFVVVAGIIMIIYIYSKIIVSIFWHVCKFLVPSGSCNIRIIWISTLNIPRIVWTCLFNAFIYAQFTSPKYAKKRASPHSR